MNYEKAKNKYHNSPAINQRWSLEEYISLLEGIGESVESINDVPKEEIIEVDLGRDLKEAIKVLGESKVAKIIDRETDLAVVIPFDEEDFNLYPSDHFGQDPVKQDV